MRTSSNPAFRNLPSSGGYASFQHGGQATGYDPYPSAPPTAERPITVDDVVIKTTMSLGTVILAGVLTAMSGPAMLGLALPAALVGIGIALFMCFRPKPSGALTLIYSAAQGIVLGAITVMVERYAGPGLGFQAVVGTAAVFVGMLIVYKTGAIRVTPRLTKMVVAGVIGAGVLMLANLLVGFFNPGGLGIRSGWLGIGIGVLFIVIAAFTLLLEFDQADEMVRAGYPAKWAWFTAFGLVASLVWLYVEILRLLALFREE
ncbi:Bax inhibitor-1/YccA family protein [Allokutzneria sp. A3M-2-11 16]|uniref:Bax inhibitor-1/YccA family protein n=1 Tax=Allokutzneria sp. A3M-2-11 16 TaxID=2962043 RepID=UPI0020B75196|nr:Bax inhibitor-1/YccA family protein [Allokutzneria sp. A3M-2-11 16]MCP3798709.1 Bax inhibitor-1/YccA family protein [Allokutzneria sp. A3M-2-11 16]